MVDTVLRLAGRPEFLTGLTLGGLSALAVIPARRRPLPRPAAGLLLGAAFSVGLAVNRRQWLPAAAALCLLAGAGALTSNRRPWIAAVAAAPGAVLLGIVSPGTGAPIWVSVLLAASTALSAPLVSDFERRHRPMGWPPTLVAISLLGVLGTVPDTEAALVAAGAAIPIALTGLPLAWATLGRAGAFAAVATLHWVVGWGGGARGSAVIGGIACLGLLIAEPMGRRLPGMRSTDPDPGGSNLAILLGQILVVGLASRVVGLRESAWEAAALAAVLLGLTAAATNRLARPLPRP